MDRVMEYIKSFPDTTERVPDIRINTRASWGGSSSKPAGIQFRSYAGNDGDLGAFSAVIIGCSFWS